MGEDDICEICMREGFASELAEKLTGDPDDNWVHTITERAARGDISNEEYFGELLNKFGEARVAKAVLSIMKEQQRENSPEIPVEYDEANNAPDDSYNSNVPEVDSYTNEEPPEQTNTSIDETNNTGTPKKSNIKTHAKQVCAVCVARPLLGILLTLGDWFVDKKDRDFLEELAQKLEKGEIAVEDVVKEIYVRFGQGGIDALNRIFEDINTVMDEAKQRALAEKPELANARDFD